MPTSVFTTPLLTAGPANVGGVTASLLPEEERRARACEHILAAYNREEPVYVRRSAAAKAIIQVVCYLKPLQWLLIWVLVGLSVYERPTWCYRMPKIDGQFACETEKYPGWGHNFMDLWEAFAWEAACLAALIAFEAAYTFAGGAAYLVPPRNWLKWPLLAAAVVDMIVAIATPASYFRVATLIRIAIFAVHSPEVRQELQLFLRIIPGIFSVLILTTVTLAFFAYFGLVLFHSVDFHYFGTYGHAIWQLLVLQTTSNFPDVMVKSFTNNRWAFMYFLIFMLIATYFLANLFTSVVYQKYQEVQAEWEASAVALTERHLKTAFQLLDTNLDGKLSKDEMMEVMNELRQTHLLPTVIQGDAAIRLLFASLDVEGTNHVSQREFMELCTVLKVQWEHEEQETFLELHHPGLYQSSLFQTIRRVVLSDNFQLVTDLTVLAMCIATVVETLQGINQGHGPDPDTTGSTVNEVCNYLQAYFTVFFVLEVLLKVLVMGWRNYWRSHVNRLEFLTSVGCVGVTIAVLAPSKINDASWIRYVAGARVLRLLRLLRLLQVPNMLRGLYVIISVKHIRVFYDTFVRMLPAASRLFQVLFCIMWIYAALGMAFWGGLVNLDENRTEYKTLLAMDYGGGAYWPISLNDLPSGMVLMFQLLVVNNWMVFVEAYAAVAGNGAWYMFITYYVVGVIAGLNILISFIVDAFQGEMDADMSNAIGQEMEAGQPLRHVMSDTHLTYAVLDTSRLVSASDGELRGRYRAFLKGYESSERKAEMLLSLLKRIPGNGQLSEAAERVDSRRLNGSP